MAADRTEGQEDPVSVSQLKPNICLYRFSVYNALQHVANLLPDGLLCLIGLLPPVRSPERLVSHWSLMKVTRKAVYDSAAVSVGLSGHLFLLSLPNP